MSTIAWPRSRRRRPLPRTRAARCAGCSATRSSTTWTRPASSAGVDRLCPGNEDLKVAAIVNFFGIVDVLDLLVGAHARDFATGWFDHLPDRERLARALSPIEYVRPHGPAIITVHGDADPVVPFEHARRLTAALAAAGVANKLVVVHGGKHGDFGGNDMVRSLRAVRQFLTRQK